MGKFIVVEGLDGSGKSTQLGLLTDYFEKNQLSFQYIHFPRLNEPIIGEMISRFLRGEFGNVEDIDPYFVALLYSADRNNAKEMIRSRLNEGQYILMDRYVYSNIAFQCAKIDDTQKKLQLRDWILRLEYEYNKIPKPDISLFLNVPFDFIRKTLKGDRAGDDRKYLKGMKDIHESNTDLQQKVEAEYQSLLKIDESFRQIECRLNENELLTPAEIHKIIIGEIFGE